MNEFGIYRRVCTPISQSYNKLTAIGAHLRLDGAFACCCLASDGFVWTQALFASTPVPYRAAALSQAAAVPAAVVPGAQPVDLGFPQHQDGAVDLANFLPAPACAGPQPGVQMIPLQLCSCALLSRLHSSAAIRVFTLCITAVHRSPGAFAIFLTTHDGRKY